MRIGFIGLGSMGGSMAENLRLAGHELQVHDVRRAAADGLVANRSRWAGTPAEAANSAEVVFTCLPGPSEVEAVALSEPGGLLGAMRPGSVWFDLTTSAPARVRELSRLFSARSIDLLDAPVSGGPRGAKTRDLVFWVGGEESTFLKYKPMLATMGDMVMHVGPVGTGSIVKLVHNCASFVVQSALAEAFTMGVKAGVDPLVLFNCLREGTAGRSRTFDRLSEQFLQNIYDPPSFSLKLANKDMTLALELAASCEVSMPMGELALQDMIEALQRGWGHRDARIALTLKEERAGVSVRVPDMRAAK